MLLLNETNPRWFEAVSSERLHMGIPYGSCGCVLAQWMNNNPRYDALDYWDGLAELGLEPGIHPLVHRSSAHYGFNCGDYVSPADGGNLTTMQHIQRAWEYLLRRLGR